MRRENKSRPKNQISKKRRGIKEARRAYKRR